MIECLGEYEGGNDEVWKKMVDGEEGMDMIVEGCNMGIRKYVWWMWCKGYEKVVKGIIWGESNGKVLVSLIDKGRLKKEGGEVVEDCVNGFVCDREGDIVGEYGEEGMEMEEEKSENKGKMEGIWEGDYWEELELVESVGGIKEESGGNMIGEMGVDMKMLVRGWGIVGWGGVKGGNEESGGKIKWGKMRDGNK